MNIDTTLIDNEIESNHSATSEDIENDKVFDVKNKPALGTETELMEHSENVKEER